MFLEPNRREKSDMLPPLLIQEAAQLARTAWVLKFTQSFRFDLANTFARHAELLTHLFKRVIGIHTDTKTHPQNPLFTRRERGQNSRCRLFEVFLNGAVQRQNRILILDEIAKLAVFLVANRRLQTKSALSRFS